MRQEQFKMERQGLIKVGDVVEISEFQSYMNYSYIIEPAAMYLARSMSNPASVGLPSSSIE